LWFYLLDETALKAFSRVYCVSKKTLKIINHGRRRMKARILSMVVILLASLSLVAAPAFADTSDTSDRKADKEQSKIERKADKDAKEQKHEARKDSKKQKHEARKDAKEARKGAKEQKHDDLKGAKQDRKDADEKAREDYKRAREDAREDYKGTK
jgi:F0F1-type ATP synthase membrane subunit b/b'